MLTEKSQSSTTRLNTTNWRSGFTKIQKILSKQTTLNTASQKFITKHTKSSRQRKFSQKLPNQKTLLPSSCKNLSSTCKTRRKYFRRSKCFQIYYQSAIQHADETMSEEILSELYFKYALAMDDKRDSQSAIEYYNKCINSSTKTRKLTSSFRGLFKYSNFVSGKNDTENAIKNYEKLIKSTK